MDEPAWLSGKASKRTQNRRSAAHERQIAKETGGRVQAGSGTSWRARGDIKTATHLIEHKYTDKESYSVSRKILRQIIKDSQDQGKEWAIVIHFDKKQSGSSEFAIIISPYDGA